MKKSLGILFFLTAFIFLGGTQAWAVFSELQCDVRNGNENTLYNAVNAYNRDNEENRWCKWYIRFMDERTISIDTALVFDRLPPQGEEVGTVLRRCVPDGANEEDGCSPVLIQRKPRLDASGLEGNGACPIKLANGAKIRFLNFDILAKDSTKVFCKLDGTALNVRDLTLQSPYAYVHNVTISQAVATSRDPTPGDNGNNGNGGGNTPPADRDGDGIQDVGDNCPDNNTTTPSDRADIDGDGLGNVCDPDKDGDRIPNGRDNCPTDYNPHQENADHDNKGDRCDPSPGTGGSIGPDADEDGRPDADDNCPNDANYDQEADMDHDSIGDACDTDVDGDGICNPGEEASDECDLGPDGKGDNCPEDSNEGQEDRDADGKGDACDERDGPKDTDGDGLYDNQEGIFRTKVDNPDSDGDGVNDLLDCAKNDPEFGEEADCINGRNPDTPTPGGEVTPPEPDTTDTDGDLILDSVEENELHSDPGNPDTDGDGVCDGPTTITDASGEVCGTGPTGAGDNCPLVVNPDQQADSETPTVGQACKDDADGDTILNVDDNCEFKANKDQHDSDNDGQGDACEPFKTDFNESGASASGCGCDMHGRAASPADIVVLGLFFLSLVLMQMFRRVYRHPVA